MGLVVLVLVLLVVMPGLLYVVGWGVNRYIQTRLRAINPPAPPQAVGDATDDTPPA